MPQTLRWGPIAVPLPDGWTDATQLVAAGPPIAGFRPSVVLSSEAAQKRGEDPEEYAARTLEMLRHALPQLQVAREGEASFGSHLGHLREQLFLAGDKKLLQLQFFVSANDVHHTMTLTSLADEAEDARELAARLFASVEIGLGASGRGKGQQRALRRGEVSLPLPEGWADESQIVAVGPRGGFRPTLVVSIEGTDAEDAGALAEASLPSLRQSVKNLRVVREGEAKFGDHAGYLREQTFETATKPVVQFQFLIVRDGAAYVCTVTDLASRRDQAEKTATALFGALRIEAA